MHLCANVWVHSLHPLNPPWGCKSCVAWMAGRRSLKSCVGTLCYCKHQWTVDNNNTNTPSIFKKKLSQCNFLNTYKPLSKLCCVFICFIKNLFICLCTFLLKDTSCCTACTKRKGSSAVSHRRTESSRPAEPRHPGPSTVWLHNSHDELCPPGKPQDGRERHR